MRITLVGSRHFGVTTLIAAQEWCFVKKGETARELWERALAPLCQKLLGEVIDYAKTYKSLPAKPQDEQFATPAPKFRSKNIPLSERGAPCLDRFLFPAGNQTRHQLFEIWELSVLSQRSKF